MKERANEKVVRLRQVPGRVNGIEVDITSVDLAIEMRPPLTVWQWRGSASLYERLEWNGGERGGTSEHAVKVLRVGLRLLETLLPATRAPNPVIVRRRCRVVSLQPQGFCQLRSVGLRPRRTATIFFA